MRLKSKTSTRLYQKTINMTEKIFLFCGCCYLWWFSLCHFVFQTWHLFYTVGTYRFSVSSNLVIICVSVCVLCDLSSCQLVHYIILINFLDQSSDLHLSSRDSINLNVFFFNLCIAPCQPSSIEFSKFWIFSFNSLFSLLTLGQHSVYL